MRNANLLYISHFLSTWNSRLFQFGSILFLADLYPGTLFPASFYSMFSALPGAVAGTRFGDYIDNNNRLKVVRLSIIGQRVAVSLATLLFLFPMPNEYIQLALLSILGGLENSYNIINTVSVERDWVIVVAGEDTDLLRVLNARMRSIDLFCKLLGPFMIGMVYGYSSRLAKLIVLGLSIISLSFEYFTIANVYKAVPALSFRRQQPEQTNSGQNEQSETQPLVQQETQFSYWRHKLVLVSVSMIFLYFTVLSFSGQMVTYLLATGLSATTMTLFRTFSVVLELGSTLVAPNIINKLGPFKAGAGFIDFQWVTLATTTVLFLVWLGNYKSGFALALGISLSRIGLWGFDLATQAIIQDGVNEADRGKFSTYEKSLQNRAMISVYLLTMVFHDPDQFKWPVLMSIASVGIATFLFNYYCFHRKH